MNKNVVFLSLCPLLRIRGHRVKDEDNDVDDYRDCKWEGPKKGSFFGNFAYELTQEFPQEEAFAACDHVDFCVGVVCHVQTGICSLRENDGQGFSVNENYDSWVKICEGDTVGDDGIPVSAYANQDDRPDPSSSTMDVDQEFFNFFATQTMTFPVKGRSVEVFYEDFDSKNKVLQGAFFASEHNEQGSETLTVTILDKNNNELWKQAAVVEGVFKIPIKEPGQYRIVIENSHFFDTAWCTLMLGGDLLKKPKSNPSTMLLRASLKWFAGCKTRTRTSGNAR